MSGLSAEMHHTLARQETAAKNHCSVPTVVCETGFGAYLRLKHKIINLKNPNKLINIKFTGSSDLLRIIDWAVFSQEKVVSQTKSQTY